MKENQTNQKKLDAILLKLCEGVETPKIKEQSGNEAERLIESLQIRNYPYPLLQCQHQSQKGIGEDCVECQKEQYETYRSRFISFAEKNGYNDTHTLKAAFDFYSSLITQYRLTECDELLDKIYDACIARGHWSDFYIMAIQARAFLRFKQKNYKESLDYFNMQLDTLGPNELIYENMALAYSRINDFKQASVCYARAILLIRQKPEDQQRFSTLLIGLSTVLDGIDDSLAVLEEGLRLLKLKYDKPHSLMAKTLGAMGDLYMKRNDLITAEECYNQAVSIFIDTCGYETPLTSNAMNKHAKALLLLEKKNEAMRVFMNALRVWVNVDNESFEANMVLEILLALNDSSQGKENAMDIPNDVIPTLELLKNKIVNNPFLSTDLNVLCLLKFIYEFYLLQKDIQRAMQCCTAFIDCLQKIDESAPYRNQLLNETSEILNIINSLIK